MSISENRENLPYCDTILFILISYKGRKKLGKKDLAVVKQKNLQKVDPNPSFSDISVSSKGYFVSPVKQEWRDKVAEVYPKNYSFTTGLIVGYGVILEGVSVALASTPGWLIPGIGAGVAITGLFGTYVTGAISNAKERKVFRKAIVTVQERQKGYISDWLMARYNIEVDDKTLENMSSFIIGQTFSEIALDLPWSHKIDEQYALFRAESFDFSDTKKKRFVFKVIPHEQNPEFYIEEVKVLEAEASPILNKSKSGSVENPFSGEASALYESLSSRLIQVKSGSLSVEQLHEVGSISKTITEVIELNNQYKAVNPEGDSPSRVVEILSGLNKQLLTLQTNVLADIEKKLFIHSSVIEERNGSSDNTSASKALSS